VPPDPQWLEARDLDTWRCWLRLAADLPAALHRQLAEDCGISLQDYDVLVQLSEAPGGRLRISALAEAVHWERSRLSHHVTRMVERQLVSRESCEADGRGSFVVLTGHGAAVLTAAAPGHVAAVRALFFGGLSPKERRALGELLAKVEAQLR